MFEHHKSPLLPFRLFIKRLLQNIGLGLLALSVSLGIGMYGYHFFEQFSWVDSFTNAAMILSGMGPLNQLHTTSGKIFAGIYALYSGLVFIIILGIILAPILHRLYHQFHIALKKEESESKNPYNQM